MLQTSFMNIAAILIQGINYLFSNEMSFSLPTILRYQEDANSVDDGVRLLQSSPHRSGRACLRRGAFRRNAPRSSGRGIMSMLLEDSADRDKEIVAAMVANTEPDKNRPQKCFRDDTCRDALMHFDIIPIVVSGSGFIPKTGG